MATHHVIAKKYKLLKLNGAFLNDEKTQVLLRSYKTTRDWVEKENQNWETKGFVFRIDEKESLKYEAEIEALRERSKNRPKDKEGRMIDAMSKGLVEALGKAFPQPVIEPITPVGENGKGEGDKDNKK